MADNNNNGAFINCGGKSAADAARINRGDPLSGSLDSDCSSIHPAEAGGCIHGEGDELLRNLLDYMKAVTEYYSEDRRHIWGAGAITVCSGKATPIENGNYDEEDDDDIAA